MVSSPFLNASLDVPSVPGIAASGASAGLSLLHCGFPGRGVRVDLRQVPLEPDILFASFHSVSSFIDISIIITEIFPVNVRCGWANSCFFITFRIK